MVVVGEGVWYVARGVASSPWLLEVGVISRWTDWTGAEPSWESCSDSVRDVGVEEMRVGTPGGPGGTVRVWRECV